MIFTMKKKFYSSFHENLTGNINKISDGLLRAQWFSLATIAAIGTAYMNLVNSIKCMELKAFGYLIVCLSGNVIFWLISEYALSHGFLFRWMQYRLAKIEKIFDLSGIKNPSEEKYFIIKNKLTNQLELRTDYFIPDQFVPIYWASTWFIVINTIISCFLNYRNDYLICHKWVWVLYILFSLPLIWKTWRYHCYKLNKFIEDEEICNFKIIHNNSSIDNFYKFPMETEPYGALFFLDIGLVFLVILEIAYGYKQNLTLSDINLRILYFLPLFSALIGWFWPAMAGLLIQFVKIILQFYPDQLKESKCSCLQCLGKKFSPKVNKISGGYTIECTCFWRIINILYRII